jgi:hypothetical protein
MYRELVTDKHGRHGEINLNANHQANTWPKDTTRPDGSTGSLSEDLNWAPPWGNKYIPWRRWLKLIPKHPHSDIGRGQDLAGYAELAKRRWATYP